jgi:prepilin-type N-terminal cleavage/methylation domain-containing protein
MMKSEKGVSLIETIVALALMGIIAVTFLGALATTTNTRSLADERASAKILAESQMENVKKQDYALSYDTVPIPDEYASYSAEILVDSMRNGKIQKITVTIRHKDRDVSTLESYKVER